MYPTGRPMEGAGGGGNAPIDFKDATGMFDYFSNMAVGEGYEKPMSISSMMEMAQYAQAGAPGLEMARRVVWRDMLLGKNEMWISQLGPEHMQLVQQVIWDGMVNQGKSKEQVQQDLDAVFKKLQESGVVKGGGGWGEYIKPILERGVPGLGSWWNTQIGGKGNTWQTYPFPDVSIPSSKEYSKRYPK